LLTTPKDGVTYLVPFHDHADAPVPTLTDDQLLNWKNYELDVYVQALKGKLKKRLEPEITS
jgi:hypothetical protein